MQSLNIQDPFESQIFNKSVFNTAKFSIPDLKVLSDSTDQQQLQGEESLEVLGMKRVFTLFSKITRFS